MRNHVLVTESKVFGDDSKKKEFFTDPKHNGRHVFLSGMNTGLRHTVSTSFLQVASVLGGGSLRSFTGAEFPAEKRVVECSSQRYPVNGFFVRLSSPKGSALKFLSVAWRSSRKFQGN